MYCLPAVVSSSNSYVAEFMFVCFLTFWINVETCNIFCVLLTAVFKMYYKCCSVFRWGGGEGGGGVDDKTSWSSICTNQDE